MDKHFLHRPYYENWRWLQRFHSHKEHLIHRLSSSSRIFSWWMSLAGFSRQRFWRCWFFSSPCSDCMQIVSAIYSVNALKSYLAIFSGDKTGLLCVRRWQPVDCLETGPAPAVSLMPAPAQSWSESQLLLPATACRVQGWLRSHCLKINTCNLSYQNIASFGNLVIFHVRRFYDDKTKFTLYKNV